MLLPYTFIILFFLVQSRMLILFTLKEPFPIKEIGSNTLPQICRNPHNLTMVTWSMEGDRPTVTLLSYVLLLLLLRLFHLRLHPLCRTTCSSNLHFLIPFLFLFLFFIEKSYPYQRQVKHKSYLSLTLNKWPKP